jgi:hypothetical protein
VANVETLTLLSVMNVKDAVHQNKISSQLTAPDGEFCVILKLVNIEDKIPVERVACIVLQLQSFPCLMRRSSIA